MVQHYTDNDNVMIFSLLDDIGQPYSCNMWGFAGTSGIPVIIDDDDSGYAMHNWFELELNAYPVNVFLDHEMNVYSVFEIEMNKTAIQNEIDDMLALLPSNGCTDSSACNYDDSVTNDDGSCLYDDCLGECGGSAEEDLCGVCDGDGSSCWDCAQVSNGPNLEDQCGNCDNDSSNDCVQDCGGEWGGSAEEDVCGICEGTETDATNCECSDGSNRDCAGFCASDMEYGAEEDNCGICNGDNSSCSDCAGIPNGNNFIDECGICDIDSSNDCVQDCNGEWGGSAIEDECGICAGGSTGVAPCVLASGNNILPLDFKIESIYPNPFNPIVNIEFTTAIMGNVIVTIHNLQGVQITEVFTGVKYPGRHRLSWNPTSQPSGIYLIGIEQGHELISNKLIYLK